MVKYKFLLLIFFVSTFTANAQYELKIATWNIEELDRYRYSKINSYIQSFLSENDIDVLFIQEVKVLDYAEISGFTSLPGYKIHITRALDKEPGYKQGEAYGIIYKDKYELQYSKIKELFFATKYYKNIRSPQIATIIFNDPAKGKIEIDFYNYHGIKLQNSDEKSEEIIFTTKNAKDAFIELLKTCSYSYNKNVIILGDFNFDLGKEKYENFTDLSAINSDYSNTNGSYNPDKIFGSNGLANNFNMGTRVVEYIENKKINSGYKLTRLSDHIPRICTLKIGGTIVAENSDIIEEHQYNKKIDSCFIIHQATLSFKGFGFKKTEGNENRITFSLEDFKPSSPENNTRFKVDNYETTQIITKEGNVNLVKLLDTRIANYNKKTVKHYPTYLAIKQQGWEKKIRISTPFVQSNKKKYDINEVAPIRIRGLFLEYKPSDFGYKKIEFVVEKDDNFYYKKKFTDLNNDIKTGPSQKKKEEDLMYSIIINKEEYLIPKVMGEGKFNIQLYISNSKDEMTLLAVDSFIITEEEKGNKSAIQTKCPMPEDIQKKISEGNNIGFKEISLNQNSNRILQENAIEKLYDKVTTIIVTEIDASKIKVVIPNNAANTSNKVLDNDDWDSDSTSVQVTNYSAYQQVDGPIKEVLDLLKSHFKNQQHIFLGRKSETELQIICSKNTNVQEIEKIFNINYEKNLPSKYRIKQLPLNNNKIGDFEMKQGDFFYDDHNNMMLIFQKDGNLVLYKHQVDSNNFDAIWALGTNDQNFKSLRFGHQGLNLKKEYNTIYTYQNDGPARYPFLESKLFGIKLLNDRVEIFAIGPIYKEHAMHNYKNRINLTLIENAVSKSKITLEKLARDNDWPQ